MKATVFYNVGDIRYEANWAEPRPLKPGEVRLATSWCGICGTDMEDYLHGAVIPVDKPHPESGKIAPLVIGHEFSGHIVELTPGVKNVKVGQRVAVECVRPCGHCYFCIHKDYAACENMVSIGQMDDGAMGEFVHVPAENCIPIPDSLGEDVAALAEPLAVMVRGVRQGRVEVGDRVAVIGAGMIGLSGVAAARAAGASKIISITHGGKRAEVAAKMGATTVINSNDQGWKDGYRDLTAGLGADVVIDAGGNPASMRLALELTRRGGRCVINSVVNADIAFPGLDILLNEKQIIGTCGHASDREYSWAVQFLADGRINVDPMITDRIYIADAVKKGFDRLKTDRSQIKILVTPHREWVRE